MNVRYLFDTLTCNTIPKSLQRLVSVLLAALYLLRTARTVLETVVSHNATALSWSINSYPLYLEFAPPPQRVLRPQVNTLGGAGAFRIIPHAHSWLPFIY